MEISQVNGQMKSAKLQGSSSTQKKQEHATYYYYELHTKNATAKNLPAATGPHLPVRDGQTSPHKPRLVVSDITCSPLSSSPHAHIVTLGTSVINNNIITELLG